MKTVDLLIKNGIVLTMEGPGTGIINDGAVAVSGDRIVAVGETATVCSQFDGHRVIDAKNKVVMPGLIDCHAHSSDAIVRGLAQDVDNWLYKAIWPVTSNITQEDINVGSLVHIAESVLNGTTTISDMVYNSDTVIRNHLKVGNRVVITEMIHENPADIFKYDPMDTYPFDHSVGETKYARCRQMVEQYHRYNDDQVTVMVGPQAINMVSLELMDELHNYTVKNGLNMHIHVSQSLRENVQTEKRYGTRAIPTLQSRGYLGKHIMAAHISHAKPEELEIMAKAGCRMVLCSNSMAVINGVLPPAYEYQKLGGCVALGSDQAPGNNRNNMFSEMKSSAILTKHKYGSGTVFPAWKVMRMATIEAAQAVGLDSIIGSLRPGKKADIILIDMTRPELTPVYLSPIRNVVPNLVYAADGSEVETVIVDGKIIAENRKLVNVDIDAVTAEASRRAEDISARLESFDYLDKLPAAEWTKKGLY